MRDTVQRSDAETVLLYSVRAAILLILLMPLIVRTEMFFPFVVGKALYFRVLTEIAFGLWIILAYRFPTYRPTRLTLLLIFAVYLVIAFLAGIFGVSLQRSLWSTYERMQGIVNLAHWFLFVFVASSAFRSVVDWRLLLNANLGISLLMALMGVVQHYELFKIPGYGFLEASNRVDITLGNPTYVGAYMLVNVIIALGLIAQSYRNPPQATVPRAAGRRRRRRVERQPTRDYSLMRWQAFWATVVAFDLWVFLLSGTRGAVIGLAASLAALALGYAVWGPLERARIVAAVALAVIIGGVTLFAVAKDTVLFDQISDSIYIVERMRNVGLDDSSIKPRVLSWKAGIRAYAERPLLGWGPDNYIAAWGQHLESESGATETYDQAHNKPVEELTTKGALGFSSYIALWVFMFWVIFQRIRNKEDSEQLIILFIGAALVGYFVQNLFLFDTPATVLQFMILLAYVVGLERTLGDVDAEPEAAGPRGRLALTQERDDVYWYVVVAVVAVTVIASVFLLNRGVFNGAKSVALSSNPSIAWEQRIALYQEAFDHFPALANDPRLRMFSAVFSNWANLSEEQKVEALAVVKRESELALEQEPRAWRMYAVLASIHQRAAELDPSNLERAKEYLGQAFRFAPEPITISGLIQRQLAVEAHFNSLRATTTP